MRMASPGFLPSVSGRLRCWWTVLAALAVLGGLGPVTGRAQTVVFTGQAQSSDYGYTAGQSYSFSFTFSAAGWASLPGDFEAGSNAQYRFTGVENPQVPGGSGLTGAYVAGSFVTMSTYSSVWWSLEMEGAATGLTFPNGGAITALVVELHSPVTDPLPTLPVGFGEAVALYAPTFLNGILLVRNDDQIVEFVVDEVAITPTAVPEPATCAAVVGAVMLGGVMLIRRRRCSIGNLAGGAGAGAG